MHFRSCFLLSTFSVFAFPLAVSNEGNSDALDSLDKALSVPGDTGTRTQAPSTTDDLDAGNIFKQPLLEGAQKLSTETQPPSIPSTGTSILALAGDGNTETTFKQPLIDRTQPIPDVPSIVAQNFYNPGDDDNSLAETLLWPIFAGYGLLHEGINRVFSQDSPNVKVPNTPFIKTPANPQDGATTNPAAGARPETSTHYGESDSGDLCPPQIYKERVLAWQDLGLKGSVKVKRGVGIIVLGFPC